METEYDNTSEGAYQLCYENGLSKEEIIDDKVSNAQVILGKDNLWIILGCNDTCSDFSNLEEF
jgi:hypothetical protein